MSDHANTYDIPDRYLKARRKALERLYCGRLTCYTQEAVTDPKTFITTFNEVKSLEDIPCRLSSQTITAVNDEGVAVANKVIRVHLAPEPVIPAGSILEITQHGVTGKYKCSSRPAQHVDHQSIELIIYEEHA